MTAETIHTCSYSCERPGCIRAQRDELVARLTTPTSAPVGGVEWIMELADEYDAKGHHDRAYDLRSLAQQPAPSTLVGAEDIEVLKRLRAALHDAAMNGWWLGVEVLDRVIAAFAAQRQEPTTCKHDFRRDEDHGGACCQLCGEVRQ